jgi:hypothetical protein
VVHPIRSWPISGAPAGGAGKPSTSVYSHSSL